MAAASAATAGGCGRTELEEWETGGGGGAAAGRGGSGATGGRTGTGGRGVGPVLPPPTPGITLCGTSICRTDVMSCCFDVSGGGTTATCIAAGATCGGEVSVACDEPADCRTGVCCASLGLGSSATVPITTRCVQRAACAGLAAFVICRQDTDCSGATPVCCADIGIPVCQARCGR